MHVQLLRKSKIKRKEEKYLRQVRVGPEQGAGDRQTGLPSPQRPSGCLFVCLFVLRKMKSSLVIAVNNSILFGERFY